MSHTQPSPAPHRRRGFVVSPSLSKCYPPPRPRNRVENWWRQHLSPARTIYVFRCTGTGLYALTTDPTGHTLPSRIYPRIRWRFERRVTLRVETNSPKQEIVRATVDAIAKHGFCLTHKAIDAEFAVGAVVQKRRSHGPSVIEECDALRLSSPGSCTPSRAGAGPSSRSRC
jgi:hypothetical protein